MRRVALSVFLLALPLSLACSADWGKDGDGPDGQGEDNGTDTGAGDGGGSDGGAGDGGSDGGGSDGGAGDGGGSDGGGSDGGGSDGGSGDGGGDGGSGSSSTDDDGDGWTEDDGDCDDTDGAVYPGAEEQCDGQLNDCNGTELPGEYTDTDGDSVLDCEDFCPVQVDVSADSGGDGSFAFPADSVQTGIDIAGATGCLEVEVHPGTYYETVDYSGYDVDVYSTDGPDDTTIDGDGVGPVVTFSSGEGSGARLRGIAVTGGVASRGAGIYVYEANPTLDDLFVYGNSASGGDNLGGGIYFYSSDATLTNSTIQDNEAGMGGGDEGNDGGGIAILFGDPLIQGNLILDNTAGDGGGIWLAHSGAQIINNLVDRNRAEDSGRTDDSGFTLGGQGGGVDFQTNTGDATLVANVITNNEASTHGGGVAMIGFYTEDDVAEPTVVNNVVAYNSVDGGLYGDGVVVWGLSAPVLTNNAIISNRGIGIYAQYDNATWTYNNVYGNSNEWDGATDADGSDGNISSSPRFSSVTDDGNGENDDFTSRSSSPHVDAGDPAITDTDGTTSDIGAHGGPYGAW